MSRGAWQVTVHGGLKESNRTEQLTFWNNGGYGYTCTNTFISREEILITTTVLSLYMTAAGICNFLLLTHIPYSLCP